MGFLGHTANMREIATTILLPGFMAEGTLQVRGMLQTYINDEQRPVLSLYDASLYGLEQGNPARSVRVPEVFLRKSVCQVIAFQETFSQEDVGLKPRSERLAAYTSHYVIQGNFHLGTDALIGDFIEAAKSWFINVTDAAFFTLFPAQAGILSGAPLVFLHRDAVRMHHAI